MKAVFLHSIYVCWPHALASALVSWNCMLIHWVIWVTKNGTSLLGAQFPKPAWRNNLLSTSWVILFQELTISGQQPNQNIHMWHTSLLISPLVWIFQLWCGYMWLNRNGHKLYLSLTTQSCGQWGVRARVAGSHWQDNESRYLEPPRPASIRCFNKHWLWLTSSLGPLGPGGLQLFCPYGGETAQPILFTRVNSGTRSMPETLPSYWNCNRGITVLVLN